MLRTCPYFFTFLQVYHFLQKKVFKLLKPTHHQTIPLLFGYFKLFLLLLSWKNFPRKKIERMSREGRDKKNKSEASTRSHTQARSSSGDKNLTFIFIKFLLIFDLTCEIKSEALSLLN